MPKTTIDYTPKTGLGTLYYGDVQLCDIELPPKQAHVIRELITAHILNEQQPKTRQFKELRLRLINSHRFHDPNTGFQEWRPGTPQYVKNLLSDIEKEQQDD
jgi:hypothetical protein